ncbi:MAG: hypothetical protein JOZ42_12265 [Acetobacteraceae bacterium]|nr:hypothetical protein [Acetobacteraceae bacterium]
MRHPFLAQVAEGLAERRIATLRFNFPAMERGLKRPDRPALAQATARQAAATARRTMPDLPLVAGGKSFGGRMTSEAQATEAMPSVRGLVFLGFPLHPAGHPSADRGRHLFSVHVPMLFVQGTRDALAEPGLLADLIRRLGPNALLSSVENADHSFRVPARSGKTGAQIMAALLDAIAGWIAAICSV